jgi:simple sugar transport system permease protein
MRAYLRMDEVITTILLNFVAFWGVSYAVNGPLKDPDSSGYPWTVQVSEGVRLGTLELGPVVVPAGMLVGIAAAVAVAAVFGRTQHGLDLRVVGTSRSAAQFAGIPVRRRQFQALAVSGMIAGLAGSVELIGAQLRLSDFFSPSYGFTAIAVALVGNANPYGCIAAALAFGALRAGAASMERVAQVPVSISLVVQGIVVIALIVVRSPVVTRVILDRFGRVGGRAPRSRSSVASDGAER